MGNPCEEINNLSLTDALGPKRMELFKKCCESKKFTYKEVNAGSCWDGDKDVSGEISGTSSASAVFQVIITIL